MIYSFDNYHLDTAKRVLLKSGQPVPLTPRIFDTLVYLVQHHQQIAFA